MTRSYRRRFLNKRGHHAGAYVLAEVSLDRDAYNDGTGIPSLTAWMTISDCARVAELDFVMDKFRDASNALAEAVSRRSRRPRWREVPCGSAGRR